MGKIKQVWKRINYNYYEIKSNIDSIICLTEVEKKNNTMQANKKSEFKFI